MTDIQKKAYERAKEETLKKYPQMQKFFDFIEAQSSYKSGEESPSTSENKGDISD